MGYFFKTFGAGIFYTLTLPITLALLALGMVFVLINMIINFFLFLLNFFSGKNYFKDPEMKKLAQLKMKYNNAAPSTATGPINLNGNYNPYYQNSGQPQVNNQAPMNNQPNYNQPNYNQQNYNPNYNPFNNGGQNNE